MSELGILTLIILSPVGALLASLLIPSHQTKAIKVVNAIFACWAAEVYFPVHSKDWWNARVWITTGWDTPSGENTRTRPA